MILHSHGHQKRMTAKPALNSELKTAVPASGGTGKKHQNFTAPRLSPGQGGTSGKRQADAKRDKFRADRDCSNEL